MMPLRLCLVLLVPLASACGQAPRSSGPAPAPMAADPTPPPAVSEPAPAGSTTAAGSETNESPAVSTAPPPSQAPEAPPEGVAPAAPTPPVSPPTPASASPAPVVFTSISFDLRSMPHRGPYDVAPGHIDARRGTLIMHARRAAGSPEPRILAQTGSTSFRAEFYGTPAAALAQCRRVVEAVAPPLPPDAPVSPRMAVSRPQATACAPIVP